jgi:protein LTV1
MSNPNHGRQQFEKDYASDAEEDDSENESDSDDSAPPLITTREDFEAVLDDFLAQEQVGNKLKPKLEGNTPQEKLDTLRKALAGTGDADEAERREALLNREDEDNAPMLMPVDINEREERWDCETILSASFPKYIPYSDAH